MEILEMLERIDRGHMLHSDELEVYGTKIQDVDMKRLHNY
jgi:hypothetical protein